jgi:hypothetical protein
VSLRHGHLQRGVGHLKWNEILPCFGRVSRPAASSLYLFLTRFADAYVTQIRDFVQNVLNGRPPRITGDDGLRALAVAVAAENSYRLSLAVSVSLQGDPMSKAQKLVWSRGVTRWLRFSLSVADPFVCRCLTSWTMLPSSHPAHRTGRACFRHPALGERVTMSPTGNCASAW